MTDRSFSDYNALDHPGILAYIFHPRALMRPPGPDDMLIPVEENVHIGACFHVAGKAAPTILFFHGNGEIVTDYDELGPLYTRMGINFLVVDYRGYGRSTGSPTVSAMMADSHAVLDFVIQWCRDQGFTGSVSVMGRSLGSASAIELATARSSEVKNLIVESGFASTGSLLRVLGIDPSARGIQLPAKLDNQEKIRQWTGPALIIHGEQDQLIPFSHGQALFSACPSPEKKLVKIAGAGHNDIFLRGLELYLAAVKSLVLPDT
ncbi:alpha/beta hydrolase [Desulfotignum balticum]|jgi:pimeloyl-ACP methyl ester carboxylesterase|uniref:alpha/beta hydrolase n=1 Tax=Desulfotignum balticum TaxID=115781 RepID=UPI0003F793DE|nr:alpha/beta hydrolase [Desulfotignum balticum]